MQTNFKMSAKSRIGVLLLTLLGLVTLTSAASNKASTFGAIFNFGKGMFTLAKDQHVVGNKLEAERIRLKRENEDLRKALCEKERALKTQDAEIQRLNALQNLWKNAGKTVKDAEIKTLTEIVRNTSLQNEKLTGQIGKLKIEHNKLKQEKSVRMRSYIRLANDFSMLWNSIRDVASKGATFARQYRKAKPADIANGVFTRFTKEFNEKRIKFEEKNRNS